MQKLLSHTKKCLSLIFLFTQLAQANLDEKIQSTATNIIGTQYLAPYRKELKKIDTEYIEIEDQRRNNQITLNNQETQLADLYQRHYYLENYITDREITLKLFALNEALDQTPCTNLLDPCDYEHNLYITCSPLDKEHDSYRKDEHLLANLAQYTHLTCGYIKWAKILSMPTTNIKQLQQTQKISQELLRDNTLYQELEKILHQIRTQHLEDSFLSFWKNETESSITANAPYVTNSRFAPYIQMAYDLKGLQTGDVAEIKNFVQTLDKTTGVINSINVTSFIQDACIMMMGITMAVRSLSDIKDCATAIPEDFSYYATTKKWSILLLPVLFPLATWLSHKIVDFSLSHYIKKELETLTELCKNNNCPIAQKTKVAAGSIELTYKDASQAIQAQALIEKHMPHCQASIEATNTLIFSLTVQEERSFRFSHPLMQHSTIATKVLPGILCLLYCKYIAHAKFWDWKNITNPFTKKNIKVPLSEHDIAIPVPGAALLPFHMIKGLTTAGMIPVDLYQNFWSMPKKSILNTTQSNQLARKMLLDFAQLINLVKQLQKLLNANSVLRENFTEIEELDIEKGILKKIALYKTLLNQNDAFLKKHNISPKDLKNAMTGYNKIEKELAQLLDILQAHTNEKESKNGLINFFKVRLGSNDLLAAYKIMQSIKDHFAPWFEALGEIDRKVSEVALIKEFEQKNIKFCFAQYEDQAEPHIAATNLWLPNLLSKTNPANIIANSIEIGKKTNTSTIILSGTTEGGKSTFERTLATANLMALTCGIVPATQWISTPIDRILLSFNATDNLSKDESGFRTEVSMIKKIVDQKKAIAPDKKILIIIDELFQKVQGSGEYLSYHVIKDNFINCPNALCLIASHREHPKQLEQEKNNHCSNYHVLLEQLDGKMVPTYRIQPGATLRNYIPITLEEILSNQEDTKNLQTVYEAGLIHLTEVQIAHGN